MSLRICYFPAAVHSLLGLFGPLKAGDSVLGHLDLDLIGDFKDKCLVLDPATTP